MKIRYLKMAGVLLACLCFLANIAIDAADAGTNSLPETSTASRLVITKAVWGDPNDSAPMSDVTEQVTGMVKNDALAVDASTDAFGDPASGVTKELKVDFTFDGVPGTKSVYERGTLRISAKDKADPAQKDTSKLVIRKAIYGNLPDGDTIDVTSIVSGMVQTNALTVTVNNADFGDPAAYEKKSLKVDYTLNGKDGSQTTDEGKTLKISADSE